MSTQTLDAARPLRERPARAQGRLRLPPRWRKAVLTLHVVISVGWLGLDIALLTLGITGLTTGSPEILRASYLAMDVFADVLIIPISVGALLSGVVLSLGTHWGLLRHYWVALKFLLTSAALTASILSLRPGIEEAAASVTGVPTGALAGVDLGKVGIDLVVAPTVALALYTIMTVLSVYKPWGRTPYGRRKAAEDRRARRAGGTG